MRHEEQTKSRTGALGLGLLLLLTIGTIGIAGCEQRKDTQVVDTPNGRTEKSTETVQVDKDRVNRAADQAGTTAGRAADQAGAAADRAADKLGAAARDAKANLSDAGLTAKVKTRLGTDNRVHATHIDVDTNNKVVTLKGNVASDAERQAAVEVARGTDGVADVVDHLTVGSGQ
jgi:hyperosmotically inducible periplasmic protein